jgi:hypothetical protein
VDIFVDSTDVDVSKSTGAGMEACVTARLDIISSKLSWDAFFLLTSGPDACIGTGIGSDTDTDTDTGLDIGKGARAGTDIGIGTGGVSLTAIDTGCAAGRGVMAP